MPSTIESGSGQIDGKRDYQEDYSSIYNNVVLSGDLLCSLAILCDGMGGHVEGHIASRIACETFYATFVDGVDTELKDRLMASIQAANKAIKTDFMDNPAHKGMGTTLLAAVIADDLLHWISVGDSPLLLRRKSDLTRLNEDHSLAPVLDKLAELGEITAEQARKDAKRSHLRSVLIGEEIERIDLPEDSVVLEPGDDIVLTSDGVDTLSREELTKLLRFERFNSQDERAQAVLERIVKKDRAGQDNATIVILHCRLKNPETPSLLGKIASTLSWKP